MQHAVPRSPAAHVPGRVPPALRVLVVALAELVAVACSGEGSSPGSQQGVQSDSGPQLATATAEQLLADARAQVFDTGHPGAGDEQMLSTIVNGQRQFGPRASITVLRGAGGLTMDDLRQRARALAVITSAGPYPKLGIQPDSNWLYVQFRGGTPSDPANWTAQMVSKNGSIITPLPFNAFDDRPTDPPPATARWLWVPEDEAIWVRCASGCCTIGRK